MMSFFVIFFLFLALSRIGFVKCGYIVPFTVMAFFLSIATFMNRFYSIALGIQKSWYVSLANAIGLSASIFIYACFSYFDITPSLIMCSFVYGIITLLPVFVVMTILHFTLLKTGKITSSKTDLLFVKRIVKNGFRFYVLQITSLILLSTDNALIDYLFDSSEVTKYSLINQIYTVGASLFCILLDSFWSGVAIHFEKKDINWIEKTIGKLLIILFIFLIGIVFVSGFINQIISLWLGENKYYYGLDIVIVFSLYCFFDCLQAIFGNLNYAINKTRLIMFLGIASAIVNIPLSIYFAKYLKLGIMGVKLGTLLSLFPSWIIIVLVTIVYLLKFKKSDKKR